MGDSLDPPQNAPRAGNSVVRWLKKRVEQPSRLGPPSELGPFLDVLEAPLAAAFRFVPDLVPTCNETLEELEK